MSVYTNLGRECCADREGRMLHIGEEVRLVDDYDSVPFPVGSTGIIRTYFTPASEQIGVEFKQPPKRGHEGHNLNDILPSNSKQGYRVKSSALVLLTKEMYPDAAHNRGWLQESLSKSQDSYVRLDGHVFKLVKTEISIEDVFSKIEDEAAAIIQQALYSCRAKESALQTQLANIDIMPPILCKDALPYGIMLFKHPAAGYLDYVMPFHYNPTIIEGKYNEDRDEEEEDEEDSSEESGSTHKYRISDEHIKLLEFNGFIKLTIQGRDGKISVHEVYKSIKDVLSGYSFDHYHRHCTGNMKFPAKIYTVNDLVTLRDMIQSVWTSIIIGDVAESHPRGLPSIEELTEAAIRVKDEHAGLFSTATQFTPPKPKEDDFALGKLVMVVKAYQEFPQEALGVVGKIVHSASPGSSGRMTLVEFCFENKIFHKGRGSDGEDHHCYNIPTDYLRHTDAIRRTTPSETARALAAAAIAIPPAPPASLVTEREGVFLS